MSDQNAVGSLTTVNVIIAGVDLGVWSSKTGEEVSKEGELFRPGGGAPPIRLAAPVEPSEVTIATLYTLTHRELRSWYLAQQKKSARVTITTQHNDADNKPEGSVETVTGIVGTITFPDADSMSNDARMLEITVLVDDNF